MARPRSIELEGVVNAALDTFATRGFKRTLMSHIAAAAGIATGSLYNVAESKEALFHAVFLPREQLVDAPLPLAAPSPEAMSTAIATRLLEATRLPLQELALTRRKADDIEAEVAALVAERFDMLSRSWKLLATIERTAADVPEMFEAYFRVGRSSHVAALADYLDKRQRAGQIRRLPDSSTAARFVVEAITWWAWHRHEDPDSAGISDAVALACVQDMIRAALATQVVAKTTSA